MTTARFGETVARAERHGWVCLRTYGWGVTLALRGEYSAARVISIGLDGTVTLVD